jgi:hypothetical protein
MRMDWMKSVQELVPWLANLPIPAKVLISIMIVTAAAFILLLIWTPQPETAISAILSDCYRRALFTRMHAQISADAMFASLSRCSQSLMTNIPNIRNKELQSEAVGLLATISQLETRNPIKDYNDVLVVNKLKLLALHHFRKLAAATGATFPLPEKGSLWETAFFTQEEADAPPSSDLSIQLMIDPNTGEPVPPSTKTKS